MMLIQLRIVFLQNGVSNERPIIHAGIGVEIWKDHLSLGIGAQAMLKGKGAILMKDVDITLETYKHPMHKLY
jgi:hypothetical protein